ncbi:MAG TPA: glucose-1-phosphate adenylyltransferase [bacterium]|nr:glucose-1-phosphate adenylyltransferase [bacterium]HQG44506.1 glucose-1-phosphate adenylyltransferase [bacterium]HQI48070.1 glucose-1-phosphate adenylyltransferase [bacterium]HQJ63312.1 glucose-1-phosphate adenylyltransferase [bacterium]
MQSVLAIILGGGRGTRLYPLTKMRAKPAVPLAGKYRLIDIPVSNCINSGIRSIYVLTQFNSASLNRHINQTYHFSLLSDGFVEILAAQQTPEHSQWFQGTADAVRQYVSTIQEQKVDDILVLSGDHLYSMDYGPFLEAHRCSGADLTISVVPVAAEAAPGFGILRVEGKGRVVEFREKPRSREELEGMSMAGGAPGLAGEVPAATPYLASMGVYLFRKEVLIRLLQEKSGLADFSKEIIPSKVDELNIQGYLYNGYWEDIGTIESFYHANMALLAQPRPSFDFFDARHPVYARPRFLPPTSIAQSTVENSMLCEGCRIAGAHIIHSIVGIRSQIDADVRIEDCLLMGADYYQTAEERAADLAGGKPPVGIGAGSVIKRAIIDKNARIGKEVRIVNRAGISEAERESEGIWISKGIIIIMKNAVIKDGTQL